MARAFLGGRGLGAYLAAARAAVRRRAAAAAQPADLRAGPAHGDRRPASGRYSVTSRSPLTGTVFDGNSGGNWGNAFRRLGWDYLVVVRTCWTRRGFVEPIGADGVAVPRRRPACGASHVPASLARLRELHPHCEAAVIGPAGERGVLFASIVNNRGRSLGRGGLGAVMGSKRSRPSSSPGTASAAAGRRPRAPRVHRLRGREAPQGQPDHLARRCPSSARRCWSTCSTRPAPARRATTARASSSAPRPSPARR